MRFLVKDEPDQAKAAVDLSSGLSGAILGFVCREVLVELVWVLERAYGLPRIDIARALDGLLEARESAIETSERVAVAVDRYRKGGAGFADQMVALAGKGSGCVDTVSFDRKAAVLPGMHHLEAISDR